MLFLSVWSIIPKAVFTEQKLIENSNTCHFKAYQKSTLTNHRFKFIVLIVLIEKRVNRFVFLGKTDYFQSNCAGTKKSLIQKIFFLPFLNITEHLFPAVRCSNSILTFFNPL